MRVEKDSDIECMCILKKVTKMSRGVIQKNVYFCHGKQREAILNQTNLRTETVFVKNEQRAFVLKKLQEMVF